MVKFKGFKNRRCTLRLPYISPASYTNGPKFGKGTVENVGPDGMFLKTTGQFIVGEKLNIEFNFRHSRRKMNLKGKIVRLANDGLGVKFLW
jgi:hypothetical protein